MLDVYAGDVRGDEEKYGSYGNPPFGDPYFAELAVPQVKDMARHVRETVPGGKEILGHLEHSHLCAPKAFRFLEKTILSIGSVGRAPGSVEDTPILQCEDTYPNTAAYREWYGSFMSRLGAWLDGDEQAVCELASVTPVKHWLVRMLRHKLRLLERYGPFGKLVGARPSGRSGSKTL